MRRITIRGIIYKNGKIFAQKLKNKEGENNFWSTPGGGLDTNEDLLTGLHREIVEETGVKPLIGRLMLVQQFHDGQRGEQLEFFFHIKNANDYEQINLANTSHGPIEVAQFGFIDPKKEVILPSILCTIDVESFVSSSGPAVHILNELPARF